MNELEHYDVAALKSGVAVDGTGAHCCLVCGLRFQPGEVFPLEGRYFEAAAAARRHVTEAHGDRFQWLLSSDSRYLNLTEHQKNLLGMLYRGMSDAEIAAATGTAASTVRRQRFLFRERARQARMYLALYGLLDEQKRPAAEQLVPIPEGARGPDDRFAITQAENDKILKTAFESLQPLRLKQLPAKEKKKVAVLNAIAAQFRPGRDYTEKEVNEVLAAVHPQEYVTLRRYLIEYGFLGRVANGSRYWVRS